MGEFNSDDHSTYYRGQESLQRNGVALIVNKKVQNAVLGCNQKQQSDLCLFPRQIIHITVIQVYAPTTNAEEAEVERFFEDLQDLLELTPKKKKKKSQFHHRRLECKSRKSRDTWKSR